MAPPAGPGADDVTGAAWNGRLVAAHRVVLDVAFPPGALPAIGDALLVRGDRLPPLPVEVQAHLDDATVRCAALAGRASPRPAARRCRAGTIYQRVPTFTEHEAVGLPFATGIKVLDPLAPMRLGGKTGLFGGAGGAETDQQQQVLPDVREIHRSAECATDPCHHIAEEPGGCQAQKLGPRMRADAQRLLTCPLSMS